MTLDQRARSATEGLKQQVAEHPLLLMSPAPAAPTLLPRLLSFAGAFAVVVFVGFVVFQTNMFAADEDAPADTTPSTVVSTTSMPPTTTVTATTVDSAPAVPVVPGGDAEGTPVAPPADVTPPDLVITSPADGDRLEETAVEFRGITEPGATVTAGPYAATVAEDGSWSIVLVLSKGGNRAAFTATDEAGNVAEASIVVYYDPPETTTTTKPSEWAFTAHATYGECELEPPYDEYYGTAAPGTTILVISDYGSGSTVVNETGEWWIKVEFPTAPPGKVFLVKVKNETTFEKYTFEFVSLVK